MWRYMHTLLLMRKYRSEKKFILKAAWICTWVYRVLLCGFLFIYALNFIVGTITSHHQCCCMDHMTHSGSSDHESMSWPLEGEHREAWRSNGNQYQWWINSVGTGNKIGHWIGRPLIEKGRTPPADSESVTHWDKMRNTTTALLSTDC